MITAIVDSGFVIAIFDTDDAYHGRCVAILRDTQWRFVVPAATLGEVFHVRLSR